MESRNDKMIHLSGFTSIVIRRKLIYRSLFKQLNGTEDIPATFDKKLINSKTEN